MGGVDDEDDRPSGWGLLLAMLCVCLSWGVLIAVGYLIVVLIR